MEARVSNLGQNVRVCGEFSATVKTNTTSTSTSSSVKEREEKGNYYVNSGDAIRTIREEFPEVFYRELTFDIYRLKFYSSFSSFLQKNCDDVMLSIYVKYLLR